jgi:hypothetical protein
VEAAELKTTGLGTNDSSSEDWIMPHADLTAAEKFGIRFRGGGAHQAKTMMLNEISTFFASFTYSTDARSLIIDASALRQASSGPSCRVRRSVATSASTRL